MKEFTSDGASGTFGIYNRTWLRRDGFDRRLFRCDAVFFGTGLSVGGRLAAVSVASSATPFPVTVDPAWLAWHGGAVKRLAEAVYDECDLPSGHLDAARLAVLADMLEEAGCSAPQFLGHLRGPGPHVRGCFAVDLLLGKV
jgi:hypothetical protein